VGCLRLHKAKKETLATVTEGFVKVRGRFQREVEFLGVSEKYEDGKANGGKEHHGLELSVRVPTSCDIRVLSLQKMLLAVLDESNGSLPFGATSAPSPFFPFVFCKDLYDSLARERLHLTIFALGPTVYGPVESYTNFCDFLYNTLQ
jgi:hypothetical protein